MCVTSQPCQETKNEDGSVLAIVVGCKGAPCTMHPDPTQARIADPSPGPLQMGEGSDVHVLSEAEHAPPPESVAFFLL